MPKAKKPISSSKIPSADLDEFRAALADGSDWPEDEQPDALVEPTDAAVPAANTGTETESEAVTTEVKSRARDRVRKIPVTVSPAHEATGANLPPGVPPPVRPGSAGDMSKMERRKGRSWPWGWIIAIVTVLAVATVVGFFVFNRTQRFSGNHVSLQFNGATEVASGSQIEMTIRYFNSEPVDLVRSEVAIEYPEGFRVTDTSVTPSNDAKNSFPLGTIRTGRAGSLTIKGTLVGQVGTERAFNAVLTYRPSNFSSDFQTRGTFKVKITSSILSLDLAGPDKLAPNGQGTWVLTYRNTSERDLEQIRVEAVYPEELEVTKVDPVATDRSAVWDIEKLNSQGEGKITVTGKATGTTGDSLELTFRIGLFSGGNLQLQDERTLLVILVNSGVKTTVAVNGQSDNPNVEAGDDVQYAVRIANQSDSEVTDLTVAAKFTGPAADLQKVDNPQKAKFANGIFTWTKAEVPGLGLIKPGNDAVLRLTIGTPAALTVTADSDVNPAVTMEVVATSPAFDANTTDGAKATVVTKVATVMAVTAQARYYDDNQKAIGSGPIPPVAGETTAYRIRWTLTNTTSDLTDLQISTTLPTHVFWTGKNISRDAGDVSFDATTRTVSWRLNKVPAGTGARLPKLNAEFEVSITPTSADVGQVVILTNQTSAKATDGFTSRAREATQPSLTTELPNDPKGASQGTVQSAG